MRVALIASDIPDYALEFADMMAEACDVLVCIPSKYRSADRSLPLNSRLEIDWLAWPRQREFRNLTFARSLARRIRNWRPDIVHFLNERSLWNWLVAHLLKDFPVVTTVHDITTHPGDKGSGRIPDFFPRMLIRRSNAILVHGETLRADASRRLPIAAANIYSTPLAPSLRPLNAPESTRPIGQFFRLLFYGRIYNYKGLRYLLEAMPAICAKAPNVRLIVAGQGENLAHYGGYISDPGPIEFRNRFISVMESIELFTESDLLVLPYIEASQSGPLMTAMAFGLPVVVSDVGELSAVTSSTGMGLVVPAADKDALAAAIIQIALDNRLHNTLSANAIQANSGEYSREQISKRITHVYEKLHYH